MDERGKPFSWELNHFSKRGFTFTRRSCLARKISGEEHKTADRDVGDQTQLGSTRTCTEAEHLGAQIRLKTMQYDRMHVSC